MSKAKPFIFGVSRNEVGAVCAQLGSVSFHLRITDIEAETLVKQTNHEGCIGRTTPQDAIISTVRNLATLAPMADCRKLTGR